MYNSEPRLPGVDVHPQLEQRQRALEALVAITGAIAEASLDVSRICDALTNGVTELLGDVCAVRLLSSHDDDSLEPTRVDDNQLTVPIYAGADVIGTLSATRTDPNRPYTVIDQQMLHEIGGRAGLAIADARKYQQLLAERQLSRLKTQQLEAIFSTAPVAILVGHDAECRRITGNSELYRLLNTNEGQNVSKTADGEQTPSYRIFRDGYEVPADQLPLRVAARTGQALRDVEFDLAVEGGATYRMFGSAFPLFAEDGRPHGSIGAFVDVTPLRKAIRVRDEFLSVASHELKTPLTAVELNVSSLLRSFRTGRISRMTTDDIERRLLTTWRDSKRLATLINELLDVSRISAGRLILERAPMDLCELTTEIVARFSEQAAAVDSPLTVLAPYPVGGEWDRNRIDQVVTNLISNALKYGRGQPIALSVESEGDVARLTVADQGIGIAAEDQSRIFQRFHRTAAAGQMEGMGLGLWIANELVEAHGGTIRLTSSPGQGSTFTVELPLATRSH